MRKDRIKAAGAPARRRCKYSLPPSRLRGWDQSRHAGSARAIFLSRSAPTNDSRRHFGAFAVLLTPRASSMLMPHGTDARRLRQEAFWVVWMRLRPHRRRAFAANLPEEPGRGREETADRRRWRLSCLAPYRVPYRLPCGDAYRLETIGGAFALQPSCARPGLEHHQSGIRRVLPDHFGAEFWVRQALGPRQLRWRLARYLRSMFLSMPRPIRHAGRWPFSATPAVEATRSLARPWDRGRAATATPPPPTMRFEQNSTMQGWLRAMTPCTIWAANARRGSRPPDQWSRSPRGFKVWHFCRRACPRSRPRRCQPLSYNRPRRGPG
jgi:hypothetical protein